MSPSRHRPIARLVLALALLRAGAIEAQDESYQIVFDQGSVLVFCAPPAGSSLTMDEFNRGFPAWITRLQVLANEGVVARAHYLGALKDGMFIVVLGEDKIEAGVNAAALVDELNVIYLKATGRSSEGACESREVGPLAVRPMER